MKSTVDQYLNSKLTSDIHRHDYDSQSNDHDDEETLSLRDLPITTSTATSAPSSSDSVFEFLTTNIITSTTYDVILNGRILPYTPPSPQHLRPRRSLSLSSAVHSELNVNSPMTGSDLRPSRSVNYCKLRANSEEASLLYSRSSSSSTSQCGRNNNNNPIIRFPWYNWRNFRLPVKITAEIEYKDVKNRLPRRSITPSRFGIGDRSILPASWKVISVLSCKSHSSVDVINTQPICR